MIPSVRALIESGAHFGHQTSRWNPKMKSYIFGRRNVIHIIDLRMTLKGLLRGSNVLKNIAASGEKILFVGTKKQARNVILEEAKRCGMPFVCDRWLGGTLTNFTTIRSRLTRLLELEEIEKSGKLELYSKKEAASFLREKRKLVSNLDGIRDMDRLPGALVVVDPKREHIAVREARILGIPVIAIIDTDSDPDTVDICIPANDDAFRSIKILVSHLTDAILEGKRIAEEQGAILSKGERVSSPEAPSGAPVSSKAKPKPSRPRARKPLVVRKESKGETGAIETRRSKSDKSAETGRAKRERVAEAPKGKVSKESGEKVQKEKLESRKTDKAATEEKEKNETKSEEQRGKAQSSDKSEG